MYSPTASPDIRLGLIPGVHTYTVIIVVHSLNFHIFRFNMLRSHSNFLTTGHFNQTCSSRAREHQKILESVNKSSGSFLRTPVTPQLTVSLRNAFYVSSVCKIRAEGTQACMTTEMRSVSPERCASISEFLFGVDHVMCPCYCARGCQTPQATPDATGVSRLKRSRG